MGRSNRLRGATPLLIGVLALVTAGAAWILDRGDETATAVVDNDGPITPVLSARRIPDQLTQDVADDRLAAGLQQVLGDAPATTCLAVDAADRSVVRFQSDRSLIPASTEKVLVSEAALQLLGPGHRFDTTAVAASGPNRNGVINGDLWLVGGGDPVLATTPYARSSPKQGQAHTSLEDLADAIAAAGVTTIRGSVIGDESRYDSTRYVSSWPPRFIDQNQTGPLSALSVDDGFFAYPTRPSPDTPLVAAPDPAAVGAARLSTLLNDRGVEVTGGPASGRAPGGAVEVATISSAALRRITAQLLTYSDNHTAELLLKEIGFQHFGEGSTDAGARAAEEILAAEGFELDGVDLVDGSGLSIGNQVTCSALLAVVSRAGPDSDLVDGFAVAGESGTLAATFVGTGLEGRLRAKTGSLNETRSLAGIVDVPAGDELSFALIVNQSLIDERGAAVRDAVGDVLARYPERPPLEQIGPQLLETG